MKELRLPLTDNGYRKAENLYYKSLLESSLKDKKVVVWEELMFSDSGGERADGFSGWVGSEVLLPENTVMESWTGSEYMSIAQDHGYNTLLAYGFYLDRQTPVDGLLSWEYTDTWAHMYLVEPEPTVSSTTTSSGSSSRKRGRCIGGEASAWSENHDSTTIDGMIWPRASAAAERLWSSKEIRDTGGFATRLNWWRCRAVSRVGIRATSVWSDICSASIEYD
jgi:hexosaminidase